MQTSHWCDMFTYLQQQILHSARELLKKEYAMRPAIKKIALSVIFSYQNNIDL